MVDTERTKGDPIDKATDDAMNALDRLEDVARAEVVRLRAEVAAARVEGLREAIPLCCDACADPTDQPDAGMVHNNNLLCDASHIRARIADLEKEMEDAN